MSAPKHAGPHQGVCQRPVFRFASVGAIAAIVAGFLAAVAASPAAAGTAPTPTIYTATDLTNTAATLNASVNPSGTVTTISFCYSASQITINGNSCTASGTIGYATATASPSSASSATVFSAYVTGLVPGTTYYYAAGASQTAGSTSWSSPTSFTTMSGAPLVCGPNFYEETGPASGTPYLWRYDPISSAYVEVNPSANQSVDLNPIGYDALNNYIYGDTGTGGAIYEVGADGKETNIGAPQYDFGTSGDFIPGTNYFLTLAGSGTTFDLPRGGGCGQALSAKRKDAEGHSVASGNGHHIQLSRGNR